jgi:hypothetical protein
MSFHHKPLYHPTSEYTLVTMKAARWIITLGLAFLLASHGVSGQEDSAAGGDGETWGEVEAEAQEDECDCEAAVNDAVEEWRVQLSRSAKDLEKVKQERSRLEAEKVELTVKVGNLGYDVTSYISTIERQEGLISDLSASLDRAEVRIQELTLEVRELLERVAAFKPQFSILGQIGKFIKRVFEEARGFIVRRQ